MTTITTAEADAAMQGQRKRSINKTISTAEENAQCPVCHQKPIDCICYGMFGKASQKALPHVETWQPWRMPAPPHVDQFTTYKCPTCKRAFRSEGWLNRHIKSTH